MTNTQFPLEYIQNAMYAQSLNDVKDLLNEHDSRVFVITDNNMKKRSVPTGIEKA